MVSYNELLWSVTPYIYEENGRMDRHAESLLTAMGRSLRLSKDALGLSAVLQILDLAVEFGIETKKILELH